MAEYGNSGERSSPDDDSEAGGRELNASSGRESTHSLTRTRHTSGVVGLG